VIVVDTSVWSEAVRRSPDPVVLAWLTTHHAELALTTITIGELLYGVELMPAGRRRQALATQVRHLIAGAAARTFSYDAAAATELAAIRASRRRAGREVGAVDDAMIAAIASVHGCAVATRNVTDFDDMGVAVINPWEIP
jgi:predicted nucleic acid-binding protein